jgi:hypothetical protein
MITDLVKRVCNSLDEKQINYMISGSIALNIFVIPRMTRDIDIVIELSESQIIEFATLFPQSYFDIDTIKSETRRQGMFNVIDHLTGFKIDFILRKETDYYQLAFSRRKRIHEFDTQLWVIDINDLIIAKIIWIQDYQSEIQISDIQSLLLNPEIDLSYITQWCKKLNLLTFNLLNK